METRVVLKRESQFFLLYSVTIYCLLTVLYPPTAQQILFHVPEENEERRKFEYFEPCKSRAWDRAANGTPSPPFVVPLYPPTPPITRHLCLNSLTSRSPLSLLLYYLLYYCSPPPIGRGLILRGGSRLTGLQDAGLFETWFNR